MNPQRQSKANILLLLCGAVSPLLYAFADLLSGMSFEGYSFRDQTISELGAIGAPSAALFSALLVPTYILMLAFGIGVVRAAETRRKLSIAGSLLIAFAIIALVVGPLVAMKPRGVDQELMGALHLVEGGVEMCILLLAMGFAAAALGRSFTVYTLVTIGVMLTFGAWSLFEVPEIEAGLPTPWLGVKERIYWYAYQLWLGGLAFVLLRPAPTRSRDSD